MYQSFLSILLLLFSAQIVAQKNSMEAIWRDSAIVIDGDARDWAQPFRYYDSQSRLQYNIANDSTSIYIIIKTADPQAQMKIMRAGMDIWLDTTGKKKEVSGIHYPLRGEAKLEIHAEDPDMPTPGHHERPDVKRLKRDFAANLHEIRPQGLRDIPNEPMPTENKYGIQVGINWDNSDVLTYELKLPISTLYKRQLSARDTLKQIGFMIKVHGMEIPAGYNSSNVNNPPTGMGGGMGSSGAGGQNTMGGGGYQNGVMRSGMSGPPPSSGANSELAQAHQLYTKVKWAFK